MVDSIDKQNNVGVRSGATWAIHRGRGNGLDTHVSLGFVDLQVVSKKDPVDTGFGTDPTARARREAGVSGTAARAQGAAQAAAEPSGLIPAPTHRATGIGLIAGRPGARSSSTHRPRRCAAPRRTSVIRTLSWIVETRSITGAAVGEPPAIRDAILRSRVSLDRDGIDAERGDEGAAGHDTLGGEARRATRAAHPIEMATVSEDIYHRLRYDARSLPSRTAP